MPHPLRETSSASRPQFPRSAIAETAQAASPGSPTRSPAPAVPAPTRTSRLARPTWRSSWRTTSTSPARTAGRTARPGDDLRRRPEAGRLLLSGSEAARHRPAPAADRPGPADPRSVAGWGPARDLPRTTCPHLDAQPSEARSEVLVPNGFSDSNVLLGQVQVIWALMHNAIAGTLAEPRGPDAAFELAAADQPRHLSRRDPPRPARHLADAAVPRPLRRDRAAAAARRTRRSARRRSSSRASAGSGTGSCARSTR